MGQLKNEIGNTYGYLTVIDRAPNNKVRRAMWKCKCKCGNEAIVSGERLRSGCTKSCGCYQKERTIESNLIRGGDLIGKRFGKLVVLEEAGFIKNTGGNRARLWKCQCDCGNTCLVRHQHLKGGNTNSCGCIDSIGNMTINRLLNKSGYKYKSEYSFKDFICVVSLYRFDFALFDNNNNLLGLIEYQGDIHFEYRDTGWNTKQSFEERVRGDKEKLNYCKENNIKLYYITYKEDIEDRLEEILNELYSR